MMHEGMFVPTANLDVVDDRCAPLDYVMGEPRRIETNFSCPTTSPSAASTPRWCFDVAEGAGAALVNLSIGWGKIR